MLLPFPDFLSLCVSLCVYISRRADLPLRISLSFSLDNSTIHVYTHAREGVRGGMTNDRLKRRERKLVCGWRSFRVIGRGRLGIPNMPPLSIPPLSLFLFLFPPLNSFSLFISVNEPKAPAFYATQPHGRACTICIMLYPSEKI